MVLGILIKNMKGVRVCLYTFIYDQHKVCIALKLYFV